MQHKEIDLLEQQHPLYTELYQSHAPGLFAYTYQQITSREDAEDIVLDVFLVVLQDKRFPTFDEQKQEAWLWKITRNKVADYYRQASRHRHISVDWLSEPLYADDRLAPEQLTLKREQYAQLSNAMRALPDLQQKVVWLRFGHGLRCKEIAPVLARSEGAIRTLLLRALQRLREIYKDQGKEATR